MLKLLIVAHDIPFPPAHGGRVEMWTRLLSLREHNVFMHVICWSDSRHTTNSDIDVVASKAGSCSHYPINFVKRLESLVRFILPSGVATHEIKEESLSYEIEKVRDLKLTAIVLDGIYGAQAALTISERLGLPLIYRSHNIEWLHMKDQIHSSATFQSKFRFWLDSKRMKVFEKIVRKRAHLIFDITEEDRDFWNEKDLRAKMFVTRPVLGIDTPKVSCEDWTPSYDVLFLGNLHSPNNVGAVKWFFEFVRIHLSKGTTIAIAGSNPTFEVKKLARKYNFILIENPVNLRDVYRMARVLINPSQRVNGINMKSVEMLATGLPFVCTTAALRGIPTKIWQFAKIADSAKDFAMSINSILLKNIPPSDSQRAFVLSFFSDIEVKRFINEISKFIDENKRNY